MAARSLVVCLLAALVTVLAVADGWHDVAFVSGNLHVSHAASIRWDEMKQLCASAAGHSRSPLASSHSYVSSIDLVHPPEKALCLLLPAGFASAKLLRRLQAASVQVVVSAPQEFDHVATSIKSLDAGAAPDNVDVSEHPWLAEFEPSEAHPIAPNDQCGVETIANVAFNLCEKLHVAELQVVRRCLSMSQRVTVVELSLQFRKQVRELLGAIVVAATEHADSTTSVVVYNAMPRTTASDLLPPRRLVDSGNGTYTSAEIADYQILLWVIILLVAMVVATVSVLLNMDSKRAAILYSQFKAESKTE